MYVRLKSTPKHSTYSQSQTQNQPQHGLLSVILEVIYTPDEVWGRDYILQYSRYAMHVNQHINYTYIFSL